VKRRPERPAAATAPAGQPAPPDLQDGRKRVVIEAVAPEIDGGRFPSKRVTGETVTVEADILADGHDTLAAVLRYRHQSAGDWIEVPMSPLPNDRWRGEFPVTELGRYFFTLEGWIDHFETWRRQLAKRVEAGQDVTVELEAGARMVEMAAARADGNASDAAKLRELAGSVRRASPPSGPAAAQQGHLPQQVGKGSGEGN